MYQKHSGRRPTTSPGPTVAAKRRNGHTALAFLTRPVATEAERHPLIFLFGAARPCTAAARLPLGDLKSSVASLPQPARPSSIPPIKPRAAPSPGGHPLRLPHILPSKVRKPTEEVQPHGALLHEMPREHRLRSTRRGGAVGTGGHSLLRQMRPREVRHRWVLAHPRRRPTGRCVFSFIRFLML